MNLRRIAWLALTAFGCSSGGPTVIVDVVTDFSPGTEFQAVRAQVVGGPEVVTSAQENQSEQFLRAQRVATFDSDLSTGEITVRVELLRPDGSILASQSRSGTLTNILAVTAVFTRNCEGVRCGGDEVCIDETCVSEACDPTNPSSCPDAVLCQSEENCIRPGLAECARSSCIQFLCLVETDDSGCGAGLYCNATSGCVTQTSGGQDAGIDSGFNGGPDANPSGCVTGDQCDSGNPCELGALDCSGAIPNCIPSGNQDDGIVCGEVSHSDWSACSGFTGTCGNEGQRTRNATHLECQSGACAPRGDTENEACSRNTNGNGCSATTCGEYGACGGFADRCDLGGTQSRTCTDHECGGGSCGDTDRDEDRACARTLTETCGDLIDTDCDGTCDEGCRIPIHRGVRGNDHFYTRSRSELTGAGYGYEGVAFYVYAASHSGLVPLFRCRTGSDHFVSVSSSCEGTAVEGTLGYVRLPNQPSCGSVVLYRLAWSAGPDHFFTTSTAERSAAIPPYVSESNAAQVWRTQ
ncbi:MAG: hypothetical protein ACI9KE_004003 [Polyangiales bacterium]|jgi:hypothetical protein